MFTTSTAKAYRKGFAAGRVTRNQRACDGVAPNYFNPYTRADCRKVWDEAFADGNGTGRFTPEELN